MKALALNRAIRDATALSSSEKLVLFVLASRADDEHTCYPSHASIAEDAALSERTVRNALDALVEKTVISYVRGRQHRANRYTLRPAAIAALAKPRPANGDAADRQPLQSRPANGDSSDRQQLPPNSPCELPSGTPKEEEGDSSSLENDIDGEMLEKTWATVTAEYRKRHIVAQRSPTTDEHVRKMIVDAEAMCCRWVGVHDLVALRVAQYLDEADDWTRERKCPIKGALGIVPPTPKPPARPPRPDAPREWREPKPWTAEDEKTWAKDPYMLKMLRENAETLVANRDQNKAQSDAEWAEYRTRHAEWRQAMATWDKRYGTGPKPVAARPAPSPPPGNDEAEDEEPDPDLDAVLDEAVEGFYAARLTA